MTDFPRDDLIRMVELPAADVEVRADPEGLGSLVGYAAVFNDDTLIDSWEGKFTERIAPGAFTKTLAERASRVKVLFNHGFDPTIGDKPLGKPSRMEERGKGLWVEVPLDDTSYNRDLAASIRSGALDGMSFRFSVTREEWDDSEDLPLRTIRELKLFEFGPVTFPAYEATTAGVRAREAYRAWRDTHSDAASDTSEIDDTPPLRHLSPEQEAQIAAMRERIAYLRSNTNGEATPAVR